MKPKVEPRPSEAQGRKNFQEVEKRRNQKTVSVGRKLINISRVRGGNQQYSSSRRVPKDLVPPRSIRLAFAYFWDCFFPHPTDSILEDDPWRLSAR